MANDSPLRLLFVIDTLGRGGAEQTLLNLLPALKARGYDCHAAALYPPYDLAPTLEAQGIVVHRLSQTRSLRPLQNARRLRALLRLCRDFAPDVLHCQLLLGCFCSALLPPVRSHRGERMKRVATFHNVDYDRWEEGGKTRGLKKRARKMLHGWLMRRLDGHSGVSRAVSEHYEHHLHLRNVRTIPNALPVEDVRPDPKLDSDQVRAEYGLKADAFVLMMPARLAPAKGHAVAIEAMRGAWDEPDPPAPFPAKEGGAVKPVVARFESSGKSGSPPSFAGKGAGGLGSSTAPSPTLLIVGSGALEAQLKAQAQGLPIRFVPALPHHKLFPLLQAADVFLMPSLQEGFGLALAEAMLLERACLCSDIPALHDLVRPGETGLMVPPRDPAALAEAIMRLRDDGELRTRLGQAARRHVVAMCAAGEVARQWAAFYDELLNDPSVNRK